MLLLGLFPTPSESHQSTQFRCLSSLLPCSALLVKQRVEAVGDILFQRVDALNDTLHRLGRLILVEIARHGNRIAGLGFLLIDPRVGRVGQYLALKIRLDVVRHGHVLGVAELGVGDGLALLCDDLAVFVALRTLHRDFIIAEFLAVKNLAVAVNAVLVAVNRVVFELAVCLHDQAAAERRPCRRKPRRF